MRGKPLSLPEGIRRGSCLRQTSRRRPLNRGKPPEPAAPGRLEMAGRRRRRSRPKRASSGEIAAGGNDEISRPAVPEPLGARFTRAFPAVSASAASRPAARQPGKRPVFRKTFLGGSRRRPPLRGRRRQGQGIRLAGASSAGYPPERRIVGGNGKLPADGGRPPYFQEPGFRRLRAAREGIPRRSRLEGGSRRDVSASRETRGRRRGFRFRLPRRRRDFRQP